MESTDESKLSWTDFEKIDIRVGTVIKAELFQKAIKPALKLVIDFGTLGLKQSSAQISELHKPEDLVDQQILAVVNFPPKQIANMISECLVLGAVDDVLGVSVISPMHKVTNGTKVS
jgi:tRNA-binding protein